MQVRIRSAKSDDGNPQDYTFLEVEPDRWLEVNQPADKLTAANVAEFINRLREFEKPQADGSCEGYVGFATRAFNIGIIRDWTEHEPVEIPD